MKLGVNIDHVATIRNARGGSYPDPLEAAKVAISAGADFITVHLREDRRHIKDDDVYNLKNNINVRLNLEIAATDEMLQIAKQVKPYSICIVPEKREELTTEGGLDIESMYDKIPSVILNMHQSGIKVSLFVDPELDHLENLSIVPDIIELHTGDYCNNPSEEKLLLIYNTAKHINKLGIECHAGHGIDYDSARKIMQTPHITALNVGHYLISESIFCGLYNAIRAMKIMLN